MPPTSEVEQELSPEELKERARVERIAALDRVGRLQEHTGFIALREEVRKRKKATFAALARRMGSPHAPPMTEADQHYEKGYWAGVTWALEKLPDALSGEFERLLEQNDEEEEGEPS